MSGLFGNDRPQVVTAPAPSAPPPVVTPPATMPDSQSPAVLEANRRAQQNVLNRAGRTSTILTAPTQRGNSGNGAPNYDTYGGKALG